MTALTIDQSTRKLSKTFDVDRDLPGKSHHGGWIAPMSARVNIEKSDRQMRNG
jgi:hypothetical protein